MIGYLSIFVFFNNLCLLLFYISLKKFIFHRVCFVTKPLCEALGDHLSKWDKAHWLSVIIMSRTSFRVNLHSILCLNVKELLAGSRCFIWSLIENNGIRTHNHLVRKWTLNHLAKLCVVAQSLRRDSQISV